MKKRNEFVCVDTAADTTAAPDDSELLPIESPAASTSTEAILEGFEESMKETVSHGEAVLEELRKGFVLAED